MAIRQISVFLENTSGRLAEVTGTLSRGGINLRAVMLADTAEFGIFRLIADDPDRAQRLLEDAGFTAKESEVLGVEVPDRPGGLAEIMDLFNRNRVNIEYLYVSLEQGRDRAAVIFKVGDLPRGIRILEESGHRVLSGF